jgi:hypothetical protein
MRFGGLIAISIATILMNPMHAAHADEDPLTFVILKYEGECDKENRHLWVSNAHATKSIIATIRWHLAKSSRVVTDQFQIGPLQRLEVGCAAQSDIPSAQFGP